MHQIVHIVLQLHFFLLLFKIAFEICHVDSSSSSSLIFSPPTFVSTAKLFFKIIVPTPSSSVWVIPFSAALLWETQPVFYPIPIHHSCLTNRTLIFFSSNMSNFQKYISQPPLVIEVAM